MKKNITISICTAMLAVGTTLALGQDAAVEVEAQPTLALAAASSESADAPEAFRSAVEAYQLVTGYGQGGSSGSRAGRALVIPREAGDAKELSETEEDLNVMARILDKAASGRDDKHPQAMGIAIQNTYLGSPSLPKNLYIEGHGALFFLNVNFPLLPPATKSSEDDTKEKTSTEWEEARRELYQKPGAGFEFNWKPLTAAGPAEEYDAEKVEDLKRDVTAALKNASHIRKLKADETVTVVISGRSASGVAKLWRTSGGGGAAAGGETRTAKKSSGATMAGAAPRATVAIARSGSGEGHASKLIVRARKADIESFQKDKLSAEDFRKKVTMFVY